MQSLLSTQGGFSTVEILVASTIAVSAIAGAAQIVATAQTAVVHAQLNNQAQHILKSEIQKFSLLSYEEVRDFFALAENQIIVEQREGFGLMFELKPLTRFVDELNILINWNERNQVFTETQTLVVTNTALAPWADSCALYWSSAWITPRIFQTITLPNSAMVTDVDVQGQVLAVSTDDASGPLPDLYFYDISNPEQPQLLSSLNTGPGIAAIQLVGNTVFAANTSTVAQFQVIDVTTAESPQLVSQVQLASSGADGMRGKSIYVINDSVYVGMEKNLSAEFFIIDVTNLRIPQPLGSFETDTQVNAIVVDKGFAYIATPTIKQFRVLNVAISAAIEEVSSFTASGYQVQDGRGLDVLGDKVFLGRTVGGFNNPSNHELFSLKIDGSSVAKIFSIDLAASARTVFWRNKFVFVGTNDASKEWQVWITTEAGGLLPWSELDLPTSVVASDCGNELFYAGLEQGSQVVIISGN